MIAVELGVTEKELGDDVSHFVGCLRTANGARTAPTTTTASRAPPRQAPPPLRCLIDKQMRKNMMALQEAAMVITAEGRIVLFNKAAENLFGYTASAVVGGPIEVLMGVAAQVQPRVLPAALRRHRRAARDELVAQRAGAAQGGPDALDVNLALSESETRNGEQIFIGLLTANKQIAHKTGANNTSVLKTRHAAAD
jgi:PAS domain S-box-containing protein